MEQDKFSRLRALWSLHRFVICLEIMPIVVFIVLFFGSLTGGVTDEAIFIIVMLLALPLAAGIEFLRRKVWRELKKERSMWDRKP